MPLLPSDFVIREPFERYHAQAQHCISSHQLQDFIKSPLLFKRKRDGLIPDADSTAYIIGRAAHTLILEGSVVCQQTYAVGGPINPSTGKCYGQTTQKYQDWAQAQGKQTITDEQYELIMQMSDGVHSNADAHTLLRNGIPEAVVRTEYNGILCQIRIDWLAPEYGLVDLKTCDDLTYFEADARRYGYQRQMAFYRAVYASAARLQASAVPVYIIAVEKREPFRAGVWKPSESTLALAETEINNALTRMAVCFENDLWPTGYEDTRVMEIA